MSFLSDINTYWAATSALNTALPAATKVWTSLAPEGTAMPFAVIVPVVSIPTWTTGDPYFETWTFQISIYDTSLANVEALAQIVMNNFDWKAVCGVDTISCIRTNYIALPDPSTPDRVYFAAISYDLTKNRTLP